MRYFPATRPAKTALKAFFLDEWSINPHVKVFLSYAVGPWDGPIAARLRAVSAAYDISILLPDRTQVLHNGLSADTQTKIRNADAVIALVTDSAPTEILRLASLELHYAAQIQKPIILLVELGVQFQSALNSQMVFFDRSDPTAHEAHLVNALKYLREQKPTQNLTALGWITSIALGLVALSEEALIDEN